MMNNTHGCVGRGGLEGCVEKEGGSWSAKLIQLITATKKMALLFAVESKETTVTNDALVFPRTCLY